MGIISQTLFQINEDKIFSSRGFSLRLIHHFISITKLYCVALLFISVGRALSPYSRGYGAELKLRSTLRDDLFQGLFFFFSEKKKKD